MRHPTALLVASTALTLVASPLMLAGARADTSPPAASAAPGSWDLTATSFQAPPLGNYAPTFTGNGYLGVRVPPTGQGYMLFGTPPSAVPTQSTVAGFYAQAPGQVQKRANVPTWSTLSFADGSGQHFSLDTGRVLAWRQQLNLRDGAITTTVRWAAPDGNVTNLRYDMFTDRARQYVGVVRLQLTPEWSGTANVTDLFDGTDATLTTEVTRGWQPNERRDWLTVATVGTGIRASLVSQLETSPGVPESASTPVPGGAQTLGQRLDFPVRAGQMYTVAKSVAVVTSQDAAAPLASATQQAVSAADTGFDHILNENAAAWASLWSSRIDVAGNPALATQVNASEFYLLASTRAGVNWSASPGGLSSNDYNGHIFWDAETWMYPSLLATHPDIAVGMDNYRFQLLGAARANASATGYQGARFPWESALDGTEQTPDPAVNTEGTYEVHITADVALAQWQYYLATRDQAWLASKGWPVISGAADFWASRASLGADGRWHINAVTGPDEDNSPVNDEVYTNVAAATSLRMATDAALVLGRQAPSLWNRVAAGLVVLYDPAQGIHPEFQGYAGQVVKQADVTMLQYPWQQPMPGAVAQQDINYYVPRTNPGGPSMADAINSIDTSALGTPGCAAYTYTLRSTEPFVKDVFDQFNESRTGGAFTFTTGIGGFLQEFLYGYSGLRWNADSVELDPSIAPQLGGVVLRNLAWQGRRYTVAIGPQDTTVTLNSGPPMPISTPAGDSILAPGHSRTLSTRRPDLKPTPDLARCRPVDASSFVTGADPVAAVDGSLATDWQPASIPTASMPASLDVRLAGARRVDEVVVDWGREYPTKAPAVGPSVLLRATDYDVVVSADGSTWTTVATVHNTSRDRDRVDFAPLPARLVGLRLHASTPNPDNKPPMLDGFQVMAS